MICECIGDFSVHYQLDSYGCSVCSCIQSSARRTPMNLLSQELEYKEKYESNTVSIPESVSEMNNWRSNKQNLEEIKENRKESFQRLFSFF